MATLPGNALLRDSRPKIRPPLPKQRSTCPGHGFSASTREASIRCRRHEGVVCSAFFGLRKPAPKAASRLFELVEQQGGEADLSSTEVKLLISELEEGQSELQPSAFDGAWQVAWSDGAMTWRALVSRWVQRIGGRCRAGQVFDLRTGRALNWAELFDGRCVITAEGSFTEAGTKDDKPQTGSRRGSLGPCPVAFDVSIEGGSMLVWGREYGLPISGPGRFEVLYGDSRVRVFRSAGGVAVQVRSDFNVGER